MNFETTYLVLYVYQYNAAMMEQNVTYIHICNTHSDVYYLDYFSTVSVCVYVCVWGVSKVRDKKFMSIFTSARVFSNKLLLLFRVMVTRARKVDVFFSRHYSICEYQ